MRSENQKMNRPFEMRTDKETPNVTAGTIPEEGMRHE